MQLAGFENVILRALEKCDLASPEARDQVYRSARKALAGMLDKSDDLSPEAIDDQLQRLELAITDIESRYEVIEPIVQEEFETYEPLEPVVPVVEELLYDTFEEPYEPPRRHIFAKLLFAAILLAALGIAAWWIYDQGLLKPAALRDTSVPNPPKILDEESSSVQRTQEWIVIFEPDDPRGLITGNTVSAVLGSNNNGAFVAVKGGTDSSEPAVKIVVAPGVMETIRGKKAIFDLKINAPDGEDHQFVVTCQLKQLGNCGRKRFTASQLAQSFIFETSLTDKPVQGEEKNGFLSISTDISGTGKALNLYSVRVTTE